MNHPTHIEPLEDRIAPATIINPYTVTYQDGNGDTAVIHISKPLFKNATAAGSILIFDNTAENFTGNAVAENLETIDLLGRHDAAGMNISVTAIPHAGSVTPVDVGGIEAANFSQNFQVSQNIDLGSIYIQGNLGFIYAGDNFNTPAIHSLNVGSMNAVLNSSNVVLNSFVLGPITKMTVQNNFTANLDVIGYQFGTIGTLKIGGSLTGDSNGDTNTGVIQFTGHIGSATIGNITGGSATSTGELIGSTANPSFIRSLHVLGSISGGAGDFSGEVTANASIGKLTVDGSIQGNAGRASGTVQGPMGTVKIAGSVIGSSGAFSGGLFGQSVSASQTSVDVPIKNLTIGGDLTGNSGQNSGQISGILGTVVIKGNLTGGSGLSSGSLLSESTAFSSNVPAAIKTVVIGGNVTGGSAGTAASGSTAAVAGDSGIISASSADFIRIGGSLTGGAPSGAGTADTSGAIMLTGTLKSAVIGGNLSGSQSIASTTAVLDSGYIEAGEIVSLAIHGNVIAGVNSSTGEQANSGAIRSTSDIVSLSIGGNVIGTAANPVVISAQHGFITGRNPTGDQAIGTVAIGGNATYLNLLAGYSTNVSKSTTSGGNTTTDPAGAPLGTPVNGSAQINVVTIGGNLAASNIVAGVQPDVNGFFGTTGDTIITTKANTHAIARIADIIVKGTATGDNPTSGNTFGIVAQSLGVVSVQGTNLATGLVPGTPKQVDSSDLFLLEVIS